MYNDFDNRNDACGWLYIGKCFTAYINYSGRSECMACGSLDIEIEDESNLICNDCYNNIHENDYYCDWCGCRIEDGDIYWLDGDPYDYECYCEVRKLDTFTQEYHRNGSMRKGYFYLPGTDMKKKFYTYRYISFNREYKEYYRLITGTLIHVDFFHVLCNCYSLYIIGTQIENFFGKGKYIAIYLISALTGSLLSICMNNTASIGASGAIFGLAGSMLYFGYHYRVYLGSVLKTRLIPIILLNLLIGFSTTGIDNFAHIGGLIGGVLASMAVGIKDNKESNRTNGIILLSMFVIFLVYLGIIAK